MAALYEAHIFYFLLGAGVTACGGGGGGDSSNNEGDGRGNDTSPNQFVFSSLSDLELNTQVTSNSITVNGIEIEVPISIDNGTYTINDLTATNQDSTVNEGDVVSITLSSSGEYSTANNATLTIGTVSATFSTHTRSIDNEPDGFSFQSLFGIPVGSQQTSNAITISGVDGNIPLSIENGEYSINGQEYKTEITSVSNGDEMRIRLTAANEYGLETIATLTAGNLQRSFSITTQTKDTTPDEFGFEPLLELKLSTPTDSNIVTITGIDAGTPVSIINGFFSINGSSFSPTDAFINSGDTIQIKANSPSQYGHTSTSYLTVGTLTKDFTLSTTNTPDFTPNSFTFTAQTQVEPETDTTSNSVVINGIDTKTPTSISNGQYSIGSGAFTSMSSTINNGDSVRVQFSSSSDFNTTTNTILTVGTVNQTFTLTTREKDTQPNAFSFTNKTDLETETTITSGTITLTGMDNDTEISIVGGEYQVNEGEFSSEASTVNNGDSVSLKVTTNEEFSTETMATLTVGSVNGTFSTTTRAKDTTASYTAPIAVTNAELNQAYNSGAIEFNDFDGEISLKLESIGNNDMNFYLNNSFYNVNYSTYYLNIKAGDSLRFTVQSSQDNEEAHGIQATGGNIDFAFLVTTKADAAPVVTRENRVMMDTAKVEFPDTIILGGDEALIFSFNESMQSDSLELEIDIADGCSSYSSVNFSDLEDCATLAWNESKTQLTIAPLEGTYWPMGESSVNFDIQGDGELGAVFDSRIKVMPLFETNHTASVVIGNDDMTSMRTYTASSTFIRQPSGLAYSDDIGLVITDTVYNRVLFFDGIPNNNDQEAIDVIGPDGFNRSDSGAGSIRLFEPTNVNIFNNEVIIADTSNHRVVTQLSSDQEDFGGGSFENKALGQHSLAHHDDKCGSRGLDTPTGVEKVIVNDEPYTLVADSFNRRIMLWKNHMDFNESAHLVLGQSSFDDCYSYGSTLAGLNFPSDVWSDGNKVIVADQRNHRVVFWDSWPEYSGQAADRLYGQQQEGHNSENWADSSTSSNDSDRLSFGMNYPTGLDSNGFGLCVADTQNNRVLVWNTLPESQLDNPDAYIGQVDTAGIDYNPNNITANTLRAPEACLFVDDKLLISDTGNRRVLIYNALNNVVNK